ncbi:NADH dehydrogenase [ubiquinone] 1 subunit C1, mitochondrial, partial [Acipenser oxyrinchus oxyrinchus]
YIFSALTCSAFTARKTDSTTRNWLRVGQVFGSNAALWALLFKQHSGDVQAYTMRNALQ